MWKQLGKQSLGSQRGRLKGNIQVDIKKVGCEDEMWTELATSYV